ncbi:MAG: aminotransferase class I/II-fold pyridoxal phosphate-dependent enzyme, partial [Verrucomicrobia bacterium]|nr:aminotransferase class I/II-fold pyridoxal phosphate-dependent enzyme [Verrucomicrobiota bacterium]
RSGLAEAMHVGHAIDVQMGTLGKALGVSGGYIAGSRTLIDWLINRARSFVFSTAPPPSVACAASESLRIVQSAEGENLRQRLWANVNRTKETIIDAGWQLGPAMSPILPLIVGDEDQAMAIGRGLVERGLLAPAIRPPTVPKGESRIRITASATHSLPAIEALGAALEELRQGPAPPS